MLKIPFVILLLTLSISVNSRKDYKLILERLELKYINEQIQKGDISYDFYNRTKRVINAHLFFIQETPEIVGLKVNQFLSNQYKSIGRDAKLTMEKTLSSDLFGVKTLALKFCNPIMEYPLIPNITYTISNYSLDESSYPSNLPFGRYRIDVTLLSKDEKRIFSQSYYYLEVKDVAKTSY